MRKLLVFWFALASLPSCSRHESESKNATPAADQFGKMQLNRVDEVLLCRGYWHELRHETDTWWKFERQGGFRGRDVTLLGNPQLNSPIIIDLEGKWDVMNGQSIRVMTPRRRANGYGWEIDTELQIQFEIVTLTEDELQVKDGRRVRRFRRNVRNAANALNAPDWATRTVEPEKTTPDN